MEDGKTAEEETFNSDWRWGQAWTSLRFSTTRRSEISIRKMAEGG
jgi:hypothetical protein